MKTYPNSQRRYLNYNNGNKCYTVNEGITDLIEFWCSPKTILPFRHTPAGGLTIMDYTGRLRPGLPSGLSRGRPGGAELPLFLEKTEAHRAEKKFGETGPLPLI